MALKRKKKIGKISRIVTLVATNCVLVGSAFGLSSCSFQEIENAKAELNAAIAQSLNNRGANLLSVDTTYFDWQTDKNDCFFIFTGTAKTIYNENIDFFSVKYIVSDKLFSEIVEYIEKNEAYDLDNVELLKYFKRIANNCRIVESNVINDTEPPIIFDLVIP